MPLAYKIRLHSSGCKAFRSILHLDPKKPTSQWEEGLEIQWPPSPEPVCSKKLNYSGASNCSATGTNGLYRCLCNKGYYWQHNLGTCSKNGNSRVSLGVKVLILVISFFTFSAGIVGATVKRIRGRNKVKLARQRQDMMKISNDSKSAKMFCLKEVKKATNGFSKDMFSGSGGFGEVYRGKLQDRTIIAVKSAKVGNIKSTTQVLNEVRILSQVNHKNLVKLLGCCVEAEQPLMIYEYISNWTLHEHGKHSVFLEWKTRLKIALQTAEALAYLHSEAYCHGPVPENGPSHYSPIYHIDDDFNAKVADFGLSRLARPGLSHVSTCAQRTLGYLDPEYYRNYQLTDKSNVYSYEVVLLKLLTSQKSIDFSRDHDDVNLAIREPTRQQGRNSGSCLLVVNHR